MVYLYGQFAQFRGWLVAHSNNFFSGLIMAICSYFAPIGDIMAVVLAAIALDFITGVAASITEGRGITSRKAWRSLWKLLCVLAIVALMYSIDTEIPVISLHKVTAWVIVGFEVWSILENMARITDHRVFRLLKKFMEDKVKENTGIDITKDEN